MRVRLPRNEGIPTLPVVSEKHVLEIGGLFADPVVGEFDLGRRVNKSGSDLGEFGVLRADLRR